jgi:hypothetical protein
LSARGKLLFNSMEMRSLSRGLNFHSDLPYLTYIEPEQTVTFLVVIVVIVVVAATLIYFPFNGIAPSFPGPSPDLGLGLGLGVSGMYSP